MADEPILSPDGEFMWTGTDWIPAPPQSSSGHSKEKDGLNTPSDRAERAQNDDQQAAQSELNQKIRSQDVESRLGRIQEFTYFLDVCIFNKPRHLNKSRLQLMSLLPILVGSIFAYANYYRNEYTRELVTDANGNNLRYVWEREQIWQPFPIVASIILTILFFVMAYLSIRNLKLMKNYVQDETGLDPKLRKRRILRNKFHEIVADYNFLMSVSETTDDLELRSRLSEHEPKLTRLLDRMSRQERNRTILTTVAVSAATYGVTRKLTQKK